MLGEETTIDNAIKSPETLQQLGRGAWENGKIELRVAWISDWPTEENTPTLIWDWPHGKTILTLWHYNLTTGRNTPTWIWDWPQGKTIPTWWHYYWTHEPWAPRGGYTIAYLRPVKIRQ